MLKKSFKIDNNFYDKNIIEKGVLEFSENFIISYGNGNIEIESEDYHNIIFAEYMNYLAYLQNIS